jgi:hypothetical protein
MDMLAIDAFKSTGLDLLRALKTLHPHVVFAGGAASALWAGDNSVERPPADWVDVIAHTEQDMDYTALEIALRQAGAFEAQDDEGRPAWFFRHYALCLWNVEPRFSPFTSRFIGEAFQNPRRYAIDSEKVRGLNPAYFLALKLEAFQLRGYNDYAGSRDLHDLIYSIAARAEFAYDLRLAPPPVRIFVIRALADLKAKAEFQAAARTLLQDPQSIEQLQQHLAQIVKVDRF